MCPPTTVYAIPELMDMLCGLLTLADIMSCASCCRAWSSYFGPYRFQHVKVMSSVPGTRFLATNGPFMRSLSSSLTFCLPTSLLDLRLDMNVTEARYHPDACEVEGLRLENLEQLHIPLLEDRENEFRYYHELATTLNTECPKLLVLSSDICGAGAVPVQYLNTLLRDLRGLGTLSLAHDGCTHQERVGQDQQVRIPTTLITTPSMTTIEVLELCPLGYLGSDISTILQSCPRLRQLRARGDGTLAHAEEISRLVSPTAPAWECLSTLEVLESST
ncbi:MAG: hypothetical protein J3Q66DRAFT_386810 [Benniella sp.]|nr:MAG: hypothetical protein J3Q66DRAFT_386810 [Benniella sp.]